METWPDDVPHEFLARGFQGDFGRNTLFSAVDQGPPKRRPQLTANTRRWSGVISMTWGQVEMLQEWYDDTLKGGTLAFDFPAPARAEGSDDTVHVAFAQNGRPRYLNVGGDTWEVRMTLAEQP